MHGPDIIARTLSVRRPFGPSKQMLQYHSRSDHHSKLCCWAIAFDLLSTSSLLRQHVAEEKVCIGVNHTMVDFKTSRKKDLDLVIARPATDQTHSEERESPCSTSASRSAWSSQTPSVRNSWRCLPWNDEWWDRCS